MEIKHLELFDLKERPEHLLTLSQWHHHQWSALNPGFSLEDRIAKMQQHLEPQVLPTTLVLEADGRLVGSAALIESDMDTHPEWTPWLASVFVAPPFRQRGFGVRLVEAIIAYAAQKGYESLYLFTEDRASFYEKLGWRLQALEEYRGIQVTIMSLDLSQRLISRSVSKESAAANSENG